MPTTSEPNYVSVLSKPQWGTSESGAQNALGQPLVSKGDMIRAEHINGLRLIVDMMYTHTHEHSDSVGSC